MSFIKRRSDNYLCLQRQTVPFFSSYKPMPLFRRVCRIISGRYLATESTWAPQQSIGDRWKQFPGIFGEGLGERKGGSWQGSHSLLSCAVHSHTHLVEAERETQHPNITPAKWGWTKKIKWLHWASWQAVRKAPLLHLFSLSISNVKRPAWICLLSAPNPGRQFAFTCRVFIT